MSGTLRIALRTGYQKLSYYILNVKHATGEVSSCVKRYRDGRGFIVSMQNIEKEPKHFIERNRRVWTMTQIRSYTTRSGRRKLVPVVELNKDFQILAKH